MVTSVSQFTADLVRTTLGFDKPIRVINNGVDSNMFTPRPGPGASDGKIRVLFAGNLTRRKGADLLPGIAQQLADHVEIIYTSGLRTRNRLPESPALRRLGPVRHQDMPALYQSVDLLLFPTVREGFPLVAAEAMASGLPVVATNCSSLPELVDDGKGGYLCDRGNIAAFAQRINELAENPRLRREMGDYNRAKVENRFRLETMVQNYRDLFSEARDCVQLSRERRSR